MANGLADNVRKYRRAAGLTQESLAESAGVSLSVVRKVEQGGDARVETLHALARALGVSTSALFATETPKPVIGDESNRQYLVELRRALMPPVGMSATEAESGDTGELSVLREEIDSCHALYQSDRYSSVARSLPRLLLASERSVLMLDGEEKRRARIVRAQALLLAGKYLTQVRQYDMAYHAIAEGIRSARDADARQTAITGVVGMCWLLLRQDRFDESEQLAARTATEAEPQFSSASPAELAVWGELGLRIASAAVRNNRPDVAREARRMAATAATALGTEHMAFGDHWGKFGPVTAETKAVEDLSIMGDARGVLRRADDGVLSRAALANYGMPGANTWGRHRLDVAQAHASLREHDDAMRELVLLRETSAEWLTHQPLARSVMRNILMSRKRTLTQEMRDMAGHLSVTE